jgi:hypothetical protein
VCFKLIAVDHGKTEEWAIQMDREITSSKRFLARVEKETGDQLAGGRDLYDKALRLWAVETTQSGLYHYHDEEFDTPQALWAAVMAGHEGHASTLSDLDFIAGTMFPLAQQFNIEGADRLWNDGLIAKTRMAVPHLRALVPETPEGEVPVPVTQEQMEQVQEVVKDVLTLTDSQFKDKYTRKPGPESFQPMEAFEYVQQKGGYILIQYRNQKERLMLERRLPGMVNIHLGDGREQALHEISARTK